MGELTSGSSSSTYACLAGCIIVTWCLRCRVEIQLKFAEIAKGFVLKGLLSPTRRTKSIYVDGWWKLIATGLEL